MNDLLFFNSSFATSIISKILTMLTHKAGYDTDIIVKSIAVEHKEGERIKLRANVTVDASEKDIRKLIKNI